MAPKKLKNNSPGGTKEHIRKIATQLFNEYGYDEVSIPEICEKAGVSKTTLHYYFPKKQDLYADFLSDFESQYNANFPRIVEKETFTQQIWEVFNIMCEGDLYHGVGLTRHYFLRRLKEHEQRGFIKNIYHKRMLTAFIRSAQNSGQMKNMADPEKLSEALSYAVRGIILTWAIEDGSIDLVESAKEVVRNIILPTEGYDI